MLRSLLEIAGVVLLRFPFHLRVWALLVAGVNLASLGFLDVVEGQAVMLGLLVALVIMAVVHKRLGFVRLLGLGHVAWSVMLPWLFMRLALSESSPPLYAWLVTLVTVNSMCLIVDAVDVTRFLAGDQQPHYRLSQDSKGAGNLPVEGGTV